MSLKRSILALPLCVAIAACQTDPYPDGVSSPGVYENYSEVVYDGYEMTSQYIEMRDGNRIAIDIFRPTLEGVVTDEKLPVVWMHTPYNRRNYGGGLAVENYPGYAIELLPYGYVVAVADFRGVYASFGHNEGYNRGEWNETSRWDTYDITEWLAAQPWSSGNIGMWGCSATGGSQMQSITVRPPHLKAVVPMSAEWDAYSAFQLGGVSGPGRVAPPGQSGANAAVAMRDRRAVPVDGDEDESLLNEARATHADNIESAGRVPFRDSVSEATGDVWWTMTTPTSYLDDIAAGEMGVLSVANWDEAGTRHGPFFTFNNVPENNGKLLVGPATHCAWSAVEEETGFDLMIEELRFFDYWLKGIENDVMDEPAVTYFTYNAPEGEQWRQSETWPLANEVRTPFYLSPSTLSAHAPEDGSEITASFSPAAASQSTTIAKAEGGLSFETEPLAEDLEITGHPVADLWVSTDAGDVDVTALIEDVAPDGTAQTYQMVGRLRASHRITEVPPYDYLGLPWHPHTEASAQPVPAGEAVNLQFEILPMSYVFQAGHKIRVTISFADPERREGEDFLATVHATPDMPSHIVLPVIP